MWQKKASEIGLKCAVSIEAEKWFEEGLIGKGEAIDDYYLNLNKEVKNIKPLKIDPAWNNFIAQNPDLSLEKISKKVRFVFAPKISNLTL